MNLIIRPMTESDLPAMLILQLTCFPELPPESETSLKAKLLASPKTCFVATDQERLMGYLITHPWTSDLPPPLDAPTCDIPEHADCLYIHDLSVHPEARGTGASKALLQRFFDCTNQYPYALSALIAVQNSSGFWKKYGYEIQTPSPSIQTKLNSYGEGAHYMMRTINEDTAV